MNVGVSGKPESKRGKGLEVPRLVAVKVSGHIFSKFEPVIPYFIHVLLENRLICVTSHCH